MQLYAKQTLGTLDVLFFQVKKQAQYMTPDQAILSLDPSNHEWFIKPAREVRGPKGPAR